MKFDQPPPTSRPKFLIHGRDLCVPFDEDGKHFPRRRRDFPPLPPLSLSPSLLAIVESWQRRRGRRESKLNSSVSFDDKPARTAHRVKRTPTTASGPIRTIRESPLQCDSSPTNRAPSPLPHPVAPVTKNFHPSLQLLSRFVSLSRHIFRNSRYNGRGYSAIYNIKRSDRFATFLPEKR